MPTDKLCAVFAALNVLVLKNDLFTRYTSLPMEILVHVPRNSLVCLFFNDVLQSC